VKYDVWLSRSKLYTCLVVVDADSPADAEDKALRLPRECYRWTAQDFLDDVDVEDVVEVDE